MLAPEVARKEPGYMDTRYMGRRDEDEDDEDDFEDEEEFDDEEEEEEQGSTPGPSLDIIVDSNNAANAAGAQCAVERRDAGKRQSGVRVLEQHDAQRRQKIRCVRLQHRVVDVADDEQPGTRHRMEHPGFGAHRAVGRREQLAASHHEHIADRAARQARGMGRGAAVPGAIRVGGFSTPESVLHDPEADIYLVSNINGSPLERDGNGFISRVTPDGKVETLKFIAGGVKGVTLNAPKGMAITGLVLRGDGVQFTAVAHLIYTLCKERGLGTELPRELFLQDEKYIP